MNIMVEFIIWAEDFPTEYVSKKIGIPHSEIIQKGDILYTGQNKDIPKLQTSSSITYSTGYINTINVEKPLKYMKHILYPSKDKIVELIKLYSLTSKFCIVINLTENPIISLSKEFIKFASELNAEIEIDSYIDYDEMERPVI